MILVELDIPGEPKAKGSMRGIPVKRGNRMGVALTNANPETKSWQDRVTYFARQERGPLVQDKGISVLAVFRFERPLSHLRTTLDPDTGEHLLKKGHGKAHDTKPDIDKLQRAVLDALTGVCYHDDAQVCRVVCEKTWVQGKGSGLYLRVEVM